MNPFSDINLISEISRPLIGQESRGYGIQGDYWIYSKVGYNSLILIDPNQLVSNSNQFMSSTDASIEFEFI